MHAHARLKLAEVIRSNLGELAERWARFLTANELIPEQDEPLAELVNRCRLGLEVLANLLEGSEYEKYENVIRRLLNDWIVSAGTYSDLLEIERAFPRFLTEQMTIPDDFSGSDTREPALDISSVVDELFHSELRLRFLSDYLAIYEEIISAESRHTAYVLSHFDTLLALTAHLNSADNREEILSGSLPLLSCLFDNVFASAVWTETSAGLRPFEVSVLDEELPAAVLGESPPPKLEEVYDIGEVRRVSETDFPAELLEVLSDYRIDSELTGCAIPVRPKETEGALFVVVIASEKGGQLEMSLSRIASAECALALERAAGRARLDRFNRQIRDILLLSRETSWGTGCRAAADAVLDHLLEITGGSRALLLAPQHPASSRLYPLTWRNLDESELEAYKKTDFVHPLVTHTVSTGRIHLIPAEKLGHILAGRPSLPGFSPSEQQALGLLALERKGERLGLAAFVCPVSFAAEPQSRNILAVFAAAAADSLAAAREYERSLAMARTAEEDAAKARLIQLQLTPRYMRNGQLSYWGYIQPADELAGDIIVVRPTSSGLAVWAADVAGRGPVAAWSMMFMRQLLVETSLGADDPARVLDDINRRLFDIESSLQGSGVFATGIGVSASETGRSFVTARAGAPPVFHVSPGGNVTRIEPDGLPLGIVKDSRFEQKKAQFRQGDKIVWVSDGLLNTLSDSGERWGIARLEDCLRSASALPARALFETVLAALGEFGATDNPEDDRSVIVLGFDIPPTWQSSRPGAERERLLDEALKYVGKQRLSQADLYAARSLIDEAVKNAHEHGNAGKQKASIGVKITVRPEYFHIRVRDEGGKLNERVTAVTPRTENILEDKGRGFLLMRHFSHYLWVEDDTGELNAVRLREAE